VQGLFQAILGGAGGLGGVVFGNSVSSMPVIGKPIAIQWIPSGNDSTSPDIPGRVMILFQVGRDGRRIVIARSYGPVRLEDAYAAYKIAFSENGMANWSQGNAVGLFGLADRTETFDCNQSEIENKGVRWRVIMHPALTNLKLGWSAMMVDSLPIARETFAAQLTANADSQQRERIDHWMSSIPGTWKFYDAPLEIRAAGGRIVLSPSDDRSVRARRSYLRVKGFLADLGPLQAASFQQGFVELLPTILEASEDYARLNNFAAVLALFRWAAKNQATFAGAIPRPAEYPTAASLVIQQDDQFRAADEFTPDKVRSGLRAEVQRCLQTVTAEFPPLAQAVLKEQQSLYEKAADELVPAAETIYKINDEHGRLEYLVNLAFAQPSNPQKLATYSQSDRLDEKQWLSIVRQVRPALTKEVEQLQQGIDDYEASRELQEEKANSILEKRTSNEKMLEELWTFVDEPARQQHDKATQEYRDQKEKAQEAGERLYGLTYALETRRMEFGRQCSSTWTPANRKRFDELAHSQWRHDELDPFLTARCKGWEKELKQHQDEIDKQSELRVEASRKLGDAADAIERLNDETFPKLEYWRTLCSQLLAIYQ